MVGDSASEPDATGSPPLDAWSVFAYSLDVEADIEAQADTTFFPGAVALMETHDAKGNA